MAHTTTCVLLLRDFEIRALPSIPSAYINRIDQNVWREFQQQCQQRINQTYSANNDITKAAKKRQCYQIGYWVGAPLCCICGYLSYYLIVLGLTFGAGITAIGAILAIIALASLATAIYTATTLGTMMKGIIFTPHNTHTKHSWDPQKQQHFPLNHKSHRYLPEITQFFDLVINRISSCMSS